MNLKNGTIAILFCMILSLDVYCQDTTASPFIHINQLGYLPGGSKIALVSSALGMPFSVLTSDTGKPLLKGMLQLAEANNRESGEHVWAADFSIFHSTGTFLLEVQGLGKSYPFRIDDNLYSNLGREALRSFYFHRCGMALTQEYAGVWKHPACHQTDGVLFSATPVNENPPKIDAVGGWHDGSDYGKYVVNGAFAVGMLLTLYEVFPDVFPDGSLQIPESGNNVPDILDEVRWEIEWLLKMQSESGGIYHKLTPLETVKPIPPQEEKEPRIIFPVSTAATASMCAVTAKASRLFSPFDATFSTRCLNAAESAWLYLETHPSDGGFKNPAGVGTQAYGDVDDSDERFWAAIELYRATEEDRLREIMLALAKNRAPLITASGFWGNVTPLAVASILNATERFGKELKEEARADLIAFADILHEKIRSDGYRLSIKSGEFVWGSNSFVLQNAVVLLLAGLHRSDRAYVDAVMEQLHYILGRNPLSTCFVTGYGSQSPQSPYHYFSMTDKIKEPIPGLLVGGPNQFLNDGFLKRSFNETSPPALTYKDVEESFASNESSLSWNAALVFVVTGLEKQMDL
ncbi:MAG: glycoside hydrolase family 9 [Candidatus Omnitrophota bacterium]|jgi:endoglucanase|nr:MAG: glycoside hydrolase family 9 [Candidatus Omnitrophota bacterium]